MDNLRGAETQIICRLCLSSDGEFECCSQQTDTSLVEMIDRCLDIKVERGDGLPDTICRNCCIATETFDKFRLLCKQNDIFLHESILPQLQHDCLNSEQRAWRQETKESKEEEENQECQSLLNKLSPQNSTVQPKDVCFLQDGEQFCMSEKRQTNSILEELEKDWEDDSAIDSTCINKERDYDWIATPWRPELNQDKIINAKANVCDGSVSEKINNLSVFEPCQRRVENNQPGVRFLNELPSNHSQCTGNFSYDDDDDDLESVEIDVVGLDECGSEKTTTDALKLKQPVKSVEEDQVTNLSHGIEPWMPKVSKTSDGQWTCHLCSATLKNLLQFKQHVLRHHALMPHKCDECGEVFPTPFKLRSHMKKHISCSLILGYSCRHCPKSFLLEHLLIKHCIMAHAGLDNGDAGPPDIPTASGRELSSECGRCPRIFKTSLEMEQHYESCAESVDNDCSDLSDDESSPVEETEEYSASSGVDMKRIRSKLRYRIFLCPICHILFPSKTSVTDHVKTQHNSDKPFKCSEPQCGKLFSHYQALKSHKKRHRNRFICAVCDKGFPDKCQLGRHIPTHYKRAKREKSILEKYICEECGECCDTKELLKRHQVLHATRSEYECDICNKRFKGKGSLSFHKQSHKAEFTFICEICGRKFQHNRHLIVHRRWHEKLQFCDLCDYKTTISTSFAKHQKSHKTQEDSSAAEIVLD